MGIVNRTKDASEQRERFVQNFAAVATGVTLNVCLVPYNCILDEAQLGAWGLSGAPTYALAVNRFITGSGFTTIVLATGTSNVPAEFGTSGPGAFGVSTFGFSGMVLANAAGSTLNNLLANDLLTVTSGVANTAVKALSVGVVLRPIQDIKTNFGLF